MNKKYCAVHKCFNSNIKTPEKVFFSIPKNLILRKKWLTAIHKQDSIGPKSHVLCCEDHFDKEKDMVLVGERLKLKKDIVPHKFACLNRLVKTKNVASSSYVTEQSYILDPVAVKVENLDNKPLEDTAEVTITVGTKTAKKHEKNQVAIKNRSTMSQQYVEESGTQRQLSTEQLIIKNEPETHDEDTPHVHDIKHMDMSSPGTDEYWKFKILNDEIDIKTEPIEHEEDNVKHECSEDEAKLDDQLKDEAQLQCDVISEEYNNDCTRQEKDKPHKVAAIKNTYQCHLCKKRYNKKSNLKRHVLSHSDNRPYKCDTCKMTFKIKCNLKLHIRSHSGDKPFKCDICDKAFTNNSNMKTHILIHTGLKSYKCTICDKAFTKKSNLNTHIRTHTEEKSYFCNICEKSFSLKCNLNRHIRTHTGTKSNKSKIK